MPSLFHTQFGVVQRSAGQDARKVSAYQLAARVPRRDGPAYDFRRKTREHVGHAMMLPANAPSWAADPAQLWQRAEDAERRGDAQVARLVEVAIPRELAAELRMCLIRAVVQPWVDGGMGAQVDVHCTRAADGGDQPHAHVLLSMRPFDGDRFAAKKERGWNQDFQADKGRAMRAQIADRMNAWMTANGITARVDHRSHAAQGIPGAAPEKDVSRRAWAAHRADPASPAAAPVREVLSARQGRTQVRQDTAWESARAAYAQAAAEHYESIRDARQRERAAQCQAEKAARDSLRQQQRHERDRVYQRTGRGLARDVGLAVQRGRHGQETDALTAGIRAAQMTAHTPAGVLPDFDTWLEDRARERDPVALAAVNQTRERRHMLAQRDPVEAARRAVAETQRAADRVLRTRPTGSNDPDLLYTAERIRLTARRDAAEQAARDAVAATEQHRQQASTWTRLTDPAWRADHAKLTSTAHAAEQDAARSSRAHDADLRTAKAAAGQAAGANRAALLTWMARVDVRAAQAAQGTAKHVQAAIAAGDTDTIRAAAGIDNGTMFEAAQAARAVEERRAADAQRQADQQATKKAETRRAAEEKARAEAERAAAARRAAPSQPRQQSNSTVPTPGMGMRMR